MNELLLYAHRPAEAPKKECLLWEGRGIANAICLEEKLEADLLAIRKEHMQWAYAIGKTQIGSQKLEDWLFGGDQPSMWWLSLIYERHPRLSPWLYPVYKLRCLEKVLEQKSCSQLTLIGGNKKFAAAVKELCANKQITFVQQAGLQNEKNPPESLTGRAYHMTPAPLRAIARLIHWLITIKRLLPATSDLPKLPGSASEKTAAIFTYFPNIDLTAAQTGRFRSRYWEKLHEVLNNAAQGQKSHFCRWIFIRFPAPGMNLKKCIELKNTFQLHGKDGLSFNYLEEFIDSKEILKAVGAWVKILFCSLRIQKKFLQHCRFANSAVNLWPWLKEQWEESFRGWRCLERCLQDAAFAKFYRMAGPQRWNLFPLENCPWERMLTQHARAISDNGPVFGAQHSTIRPTDFRYFDSPDTFSDPICKLFQPDVIAGNGNSACSQWRQNDMPPKHLQKVEALRYLYLASMKRPQLTQKRLLVLTSFFADETFYHLHLLKEVLEAGLLADWKVELKPHPYLAVDSWLQTLKPELRNGIQLSARPLPELLERGPCVWASNSTTAALEAAYMGLPLMVMAAKNDFDLCPIQDIPGLMRTATLEDVKGALENMEPLAVPPGYLDLDPDLKAWKKLLTLN